MQWLVKITNGRNGWKWMPFIHDNFGIDQNAETLDKERWSYRNPLHSKTQIIILNNFILFGASQ